MYTLSIGGRLFTLLPDESREFQFPMLDDGIWLWFAAGDMDVWVTYDSASKKFDWEEGARRPDPTQVESNAVTLTVRREHVSREYGWPDGIEGG
jgi:hypothetical protein